jgi:hypothetical protein
MATNDINASKELRRILIEERNKATSPIQTGILKPMVFVNRETTIAQVWEGFMNNLFWLSMSSANPTEHRRKRNIHFFDQIYGAGKTRISMELIIQLNEHYDDILNRVLLIAYKKSPKEEYFEFIRSELAKLRDAKTVTYVDPALTDENQILMHIVEWLYRQLGITPPPTTPMDFIQKIKETNTLLIIHVEEVRNNRESTGALVRALIQLEETAASFGHHVQCVMTGKGTRISMVRIYINSLTLCSLV